MRTKKSILFHEEAKTKNKTDRNGFCVNSPLVSNEAGHPDATDLTRDNSPRES